MVTRRDYNEEMVQAAHSVLIELAALMGEYRDGIALIGGWVPELLLPEASERHVGSIDVDLALDQHMLVEVGYETICTKLTSAGYRQDERQPFIFFREVPIGSGYISIEVDLLAGEYQGTGKSHRTQIIQDVRARKARGCDIVFSMTVDVTLTGRHPDGYEDSVQMRIAGIVPFLVMKGMAMADRMKEKDPYDIYFVLKNYPGGLDALIDEIRPHIHNGLVREGLENIAMKFESPDHMGPESIADFEEESDLDERSLIKRDAYERVIYLLKGVGILPMD